jgi:hypothetical protein
MTLALHREMLFGADIAGGSAGYSIHGILNGTALGAATPCGPLDINAAFCAKSAQLMTSNLSTRLNGTWQVQLSNGATIDTFNLPATTGIPTTPVPFPTRVTIIGAVDWFCNGLIEPKVIREATSQYFDEMDVLRAFLQECCVVDLPN